MSNFREENKFLIYSVVTFGLYVWSIERFVTNKCFLAFLAVWTKIPSVFIPVTLIMDVRAILMDDMSMIRRFAFVRKVFIYLGFVLKNVLFYWHRGQIEKLMDLWDDSFQQEFFPEKHLISRKKNQDENRRTVTGMIMLAMTAALSYSVPSYFNKKKEIGHPSGLIYPRRSPEFEMAVTFDVWVSITCIMAALFDAILIVFLSHVRCKLVFLRDTLADIIDELIIDNEGRLLGKRDDNQVAPSEADYLEKVFPSGEDRIEERRYEEREHNSKEFKGNLANAESKLRVWIVHHQEAIWFFEKVSKVYSNIATFQLGYTAIYTAMTALYAVQLRLSLVVMANVLVACSNLTSLFFWCKISGELMGIEVFSESFGRAWFLFPKRIKTAFSFIIMRSKKPLCLYGFSLYAMNLATFFAILKLAYQFFAFMVQIINKQH